MNRRHLKGVGRFLALFLSLALAAPSPGLALHQMEPTENVGLEEDLSDALKRGPASAQSSVIARHGQPSSGGLEEQREGFEKLMRLLPILEDVLHKATTEDQDPETVLSSKESEIQEIGLSYRAIYELLFDQQALAEFEWELEERGLVPAVEGITLHDATVRARLHNIIFPLQLMEAETQPSNLSVNGLTFQLQVILEGWEEDGTLSPNTPLNRKSFPKYTKQIIRSLFQIAGLSAGGLEEGGTVGGQQKAVGRRSPMTHDSRPMTALAASGLEELAAGFGALAGAMERFRQMPGMELEFRSTVSERTGVIADLSGGLEDAAVALYLPRGSTALVGLEELMKAEQLTGRTGLEEGVNLFPVTGGNYASQIKRAIESLQGERGEKVDSVRIFSTGLEEPVRAAVAAGAPNIPVYIRANLALRELLANLGAVFNQALENFLDLVRQSADYAWRYL